MYICFYLVATLTFSANAPVVFIKLQQVNMESQFGSVLWPKVLTHQALLVSAVAAGCPQTQCTPWLPDHRADTRPLEF